MACDEVDDIVDVTLTEHLIARTRGDDCAPLVATPFIDSTDVVMVFRPDMVLDWASPALRSVYGWDPAQVVGTKLSMVDPFAGDVLRSCMRAMEERAEIFESTGMLRSADGEQRWTHNRHRMAWTDDGTLGFSAVTVRDIDETVRATEELRRLQAEVELMWSTTAEVVYRSSMDGLIEWISPNVVDLLGWTPEAIVGEKLILLAHPDDRPLMASRQHLLSIGRAVSCRARLRTAAHEYRRVELAVRPLRADDGSIIGRVGRWRALDDGDG